MHTCLRTTHVQINIQASENTSQRNLQFVASGVIIYQVPCVFATPLNRVLPCNLDPHCGSRTALREVQNNFRGQYGGGENGGGIRDYSNVNIRKDCTYANIHIQQCIKHLHVSRDRKTKSKPYPPNPLAIAFFSPKFSELLYQPVVAHLQILTCSKDSHSLY